MSLENVISEVWAKTLLVSLKKALVFEPLTNSDYEGDISAQGDRVHITEIGPVAVSDYTKDTDITISALDDAMKTLLIDQAKYFANSIDDKDTKQSAVEIMADYLEEAGYAMANTIDQHLAGLQSDAGVFTDLGTTSTAIDVSAGNVIEYIGIVKQKLAEQNAILDDSAWAVVEPWFIQKMEMAEIAKDTDNTRILQNGYYGKVLGFHFYMSNNIENTSSTTFSKTMWGIRKAISYASQLVKLESGRVEKQFGTYVKGLNVYGSKVVYPACLARLICTRQDG